MHIGYLSEAFTYFREASKPAKKKEGRLEGILRKLKRKHEQHKAVSKRRRPTQIISPPREKSFKNDYVPQYTNHKVQKKGNEWFDDKFRMRKETVDRVIRERLLSNRGIGNFFDPLPIEVIQFYRDYFRHGGAAVTAMIRLNYDMMATGRAA